MYVDGYLPGSYGEIHKISALETIQFSATSVIQNIGKCLTLDSKVAGDLVYVLGITRDELGASEYYEHFGYAGLNVPKVIPEEFSKLYIALGQAVQDDMMASAHGIYRGGLGIHLAMAAMGGNLGMAIDLGTVPMADIERNDTLLFSESAGRFIVTIDPECKDRFEAVFQGLPCACIGRVTETTDLAVQGLKGESILSLPVSELKAAWKRPFGDLI